MLDPEFILDAVAHEWLLDRFGPDAESWCDGLAGLAAAYCQRWGLELDKALSGGTSRVFLGRRDGTRPVVLKLTPDRSVAESEAIALRAWARTPHAVDLLESDPEAGALLVDWVMPGTKAAALSWLPPFEDFAGLLAGLRDAGGQDVAALRSTAEGVEFIYGLIARRARDPYASRFVPPGMVARGHALARELTASTSDYGLVHGDLHLFNILDGGLARGLGCPRRPGWRPQPAIQHLQRPGVRDGTPAGRDPARPAEERTNWPLAPPTRRRAGEHAWAERSARSTRMALAGCSNSTAAAAAGRR